jgi:hypothetical protein
MSDATNSLQSKMPPEKVYLRVEHLRGITAYVYLKNLWIDAQLNVWIEKGAPVKLRSEYPTDIKIREDKGYILVNPDSLSAEHTFTPKTEEESNKLKAESLPVRFINNL